MMKTLSALVFGMLMSGCGVPANDEDVGFDTQEASSGFCQVQGSAETGYCVYHSNTQYYLVHCVFQPQCGPRPAQGTISSYGPYTVDSSVCTCLR